MPENKAEKSFELIVYPGFDPKRRLYRCFVHDTINNKSELVILNWLVSLRSEIDPAAAAKVLLPILEKSVSAFSTDQHSLLSILRHIADHPREKLFGTGRKSRRAHQRRRELKS